VRDDTSAAAGAADHGAGRWGPRVSGFVVPDVNRFAGGVADGVVGEWCQAVLAAVPRPGLRGSRGSHDRAETRIGDHVRPGHRRLFVAFEDDGVGAVVVGKTAAPIGMVEHRDLDRCVREHLLCRSRRHEGHRRRRDGRRLVELGAQVAVVSAEHGAGHRFEHAPLGV